MARKKKIDAATQEVNLTPMIDCTFQLIIFFILTAKMASDELAKVSLPQPIHSQALTAEEGKGDPNAMKGKIIVNVVNKYGDDDKNRNPGDSAKAKNYQMGSDKIEPGDIEKLTNLIKVKRENLLADTDNIIKPENIMVEIRADKDIEFQDIEPVMMAAAEAKISKMSMTALADPK